jgi:hypothetical protein
MIPNEKYLKYKIVYLDKIYNLCIKLIHIEFICNSDVFFLKMRWELPPYEAFALGGWEIVSYSEQSHITAVHNNM